MENLVDSLCCLVKRVQACEHQLTGQQIERHEAVQLRLFRSARLILKAVRPRNGPFCHPFSEGSALGLKHILQQCRPYICGLNVVRVLMNISGIRWKVNLEAVAQRHIGVGKASGRYVGWLRYDRDAVYYPHLTRSS